MICRSPWFRGRALGQFFKGKSEFKSELHLSIHRVTADLCCGSSQNKLQLSKSKFRWLVTQAWSVCARVSRAGLCLPRHAVLGDVCGALGAVTVLTAQGQNLGSKVVSWVKWIHELVPGARKL